MTTVYELSIYRRKVNLLMGVLTLTDEDGNVNDRWTFKGDGAISLPDSGSWFRTDSYSKVTLVGQDDRIVGDFKYRSWPLTSGVLGTLRTINEIRQGDDTGNFHYVVERVS